MTRKMTELEVIPLKHTVEDRLIAMSIKGAVIIAVGIVFVAALVGLFA